MTKTNLTKKDILSEGAIEFLNKLTRKFRGQLNSVLENRRKIQKNIDKGLMPQFIEETRNIRESKWEVSTLPFNLRCRTVEITGPAERKMMINAFNTNANCFMCDIEDSLSPTWENIINAQINLHDYCHRNLTHYDVNKDKIYYIFDYDKNPIMHVRPRGLHMVEHNFLVDGEPIPASFFDFGLHMYHNGLKLLINERGPYFYLPKLQHYLEARLWNNIFNFTQDYLDIPRGTIKATVLVEHISLAFQMDEVLFELRNHSGGLNCGRWDYIFSFIKTFKKSPDFVLPDRKDITMSTHFMESYVKLLTETCHKRGVHAMGGMAAQIPVRNNPEVNKLNLEKVFNDKQNEAANGMDGTWVAHPGLINTALQAFKENALIIGDNQIVYKPQYNISESDLLRVPEGVITEKGILENINALVLYLHSWLNGRGAVAINNKMEDAATAEISRLQLWQWIYHNKKTNEGKEITYEYVEELTNKISSYEKINDIFLKMISKEKPDNFLTTELIKFL